MLLFFYWRSDNCTHLYTSKKNGLSVVNKLKESMYYFFLHKQQASLDMECLHKKMGKMVRVRVF